MLEQQSCVCRCKAPVPPELAAVGRCVAHFISSVEGTCAQMHREIVLRRVDVERQAAVANYIRESAQLLAQVASNRRLSDDLKPRILSSFLCIMNLRDRLDRVYGLHLVEQSQGSGAAAVVAAGAG